MVAAGQVSLPGWNAMDSKIVFYPCDHGFRQQVSEGIHFKPTGCRSRQVSVTAIHFSQMNLCLQGTMEGQ